MIRRQDDHRPDVVLPNHPPKVRDGLLHRVLRQDELVEVDEPRQPRRIDVIGAFDVGPRDERHPGRVQRQKVKVAILALVADPQRGLVLPVDRTEGSEELELAVYELPRDGVLIRCVGVLQAGDVSREVGSADAGLPGGHGFGEGVEDEGVLLFRLLKRNDSNCSVQKYFMCIRILGPPSYS